MIKMNLQMFGGRGGGSGMSSSTSGASGGASMEARSEANNKTISNMSVSRIDSAVKGYLDKELTFDSKAENRAFINRISGIKKNGEPTKTALDNAKEYAINVVINASGMGMDMLSYALTDANKEKIGRQLVKYAATRRSEFN